MNDGVPVAEEAPIRLYQRTALCKRPDAVTGAEIDKPHGGQAVALEKATPGHGLFSR